MDYSTVNALGRALDYGSAQVEAIGNNMANVNTPGYKRKEASFEAMLNQAQGDLTMVPPMKDDPRDIDPPDDTDAGGGQGYVVTDRSGSMRLDGNNVDVDVESAKLAAAEVFYSGASQLLQNEFSGLKYVISGGS